MRCRCAEALEIMTSRRWRVVEYMTRDGPPSESPPRKYSLVRCDSCGREWVTRGAYVEALRAASAKTLLEEREAQQRVQRQQKAQRERERREREKPRRLHQDTDH